VRDAIELASDVEGLTARPASALGDPKDDLGVTCTQHWCAHVKGLRDARMAATPSGEGATDGGEEADAA
jgi:hypothetical protein